MIRFVVFTLFAATAVFSTTIPKGLVPIPDGRIVDGNDTTIEEFPHQISLRYFGRHRCGGAIYSERVIVTAAHCVDGIDKQHLSIVAGATRISDIGINSKIENKYVHENYNSLSLNNDVAVLILKDALPLGKFIQPIPLQESNIEIKPGTKATVSGWGRLTEGGNVPDILQYVNVPIVNSKECADVYAEVDFKITNAMICAGYKDGGRNTCHGDSGGPLIANGKLIGLVSGAVGCARPNYPTFFAKISYLHKWILSKIEN